jgi:hypothetical protein
MFHEVLSKLIHKNFKVLKGLMFYVFSNKQRSIFLQNGKKGWNDHELE